MKKLFNWLARKSGPQPTLGYIALRPFLRGGNDINEVFYNTFKLKNGGRIVERAFFLTGCFTAAAAATATAPLTGFIAAAAILTGTKTVGLLAGKLTDHLVWDVNSRVIPRREAKKAQDKKNPKP